MERRNIREGKLPFAMQLLAQQHEGPSSLGKTDSDDEFFDCDDDRVVDEEGKDCNLMKIIFYEEIFLTFQRTCTSISVESSRTHIKTRKNATYRLR
jgi:hypothetical protein